MNTSELESKKAKILRWKLNLNLVIALFNMVALTVVIGSLNQINKNVNATGQLCSEQIETLEKSLKGTKK